jgi:hypothetical protein
MVREFGWSRTMVTSGNAISKLVVGPLFGFGAGWIVDRFGPRRLMMAGILMAGGALVGLGVTSVAWTFYLFYFFNALGYVCGGPLPCQVLVSRWFTRRGKVMGIAYLGSASAARSSAACRVDDRTSFGGCVQSGRARCPRRSRSRRWCGRIQAGRSAAFALRGDNSTPNSAHARLLPAGARQHVLDAALAEQPARSCSSLDRGYSQTDAAGSSPGRPSTSWASCSWDGWRIACRENTSCC